MTKGRKQTILALIAVIIMITIFCVVMVNDDLRVPPVATGVAVVVDKSSLPHKNKLILEAGGKRYVTYDDRYFIGDTVDIEIRRYLNRSELMAEILSLHRKDTNSF